MFVFLEPSRASVESYKNDNALKAFGTLNHGRGINGSVSRSTFLLRCYSFQDDAVVGHGRGPLEHYIFSPHAAQNFESAGTSALHLAQVAAAPLAEA